MRTPWVAAAVGVLGLVWCGCGRERPDSPPQGSVKPPASQSSAAEGLHTSGAAIEDAATSPADAKVAAAAVTTAEWTKSASQPSDDDVPLAAAPQQPPHERIAVFTLGGPLIVDVVITLDGRPHTAPFEELVRKALAAADSDRDGRPTWRELAANEEYLAAAAQPGVPPPGEQQFKALIQRYDENRDGQLQSHEAAAWLGRDVGMSLRAFGLRSSRSYRSNPRSNSRVWQLLDSNRDAYLTAEEAAAAPLKFWRFDANDDRVIAPTELATLREQLDAAASPTVAASSVASRDAAIHLEQTMPVDRLEYLLSDLYSPRQPLGPTSFPGVPALFSKLDLDRNGRLDRVELADLLTLEPHLRLTAQFNRTASPPAGGAALQVAGHAAELKLIAQSGNRAVLTNGHVRLIVSAHDLMPSTPATTPQQADRINAMVHDECDTLFEELDENSDGRLGEREIAACSERLMAQDANRDGQLAADELTEAMIVAFLRGERPSETSFFIPASVATSAASDSVPAWFARSDFNGDGDISRREFVGSLEQFRRLDTNGNGFVDATEAMVMTATPQAATGPQPQDRRDKTERSAP